MTCLKKMKPHTLLLKIPLFEPLIQDSCYEGNLGCDSIILTNVHLIEFSKKVVAFCSENRSLQMFKRIGNRTSQFLILRQAKPIFY